MRNERIVKIVKDLLALSEDNSKHAEESHNAFLKAQELMVKYGINPSEVTSDDEVIEIFERSVTDYKRLFWWERRLARIVAKNFRCKNYIQWKKKKEWKQKKQKIVFMGAGEDSELAGEMYKLVVEATLFYTKRYMKKEGLKGSSAKNDYILGFVDGLKEKFEEQTEKEGWGLILAVPKAVQEKYEKDVTGEAAPFTAPRITTEKHYHKGFKDGNSIDYKKETIDQ